MATVNPYINFGGNCEEAFNFYKSVFGGEFLDLNRFSEAPPDSGMGAAEGDLIMHISLPLAPGFILMGSDVPASMGGVKMGDNVQISINTDNSAETERLYNGLSAGGEISMPLQKTFWGARFGSFMDKYGVHWMVNEVIKQD